MKEIAFIWDIPKKENNKRVSLFKKLFGFKQKYKSKHYYYNGILTKWSNGKRIVDCHHQILGDSCFSIPEMERNFVPAIAKAFKDLNIPARKLVLIENELI